MLPIAAQVQYFFCIDQWYFFHVFPGIHLWLEGLSTSTLDIGLLFRHYVILRLLGFAFAFFDFAVPLPFPMTNCTDYPVVMSLTSSAVSSKTPALIQGFIFYSMG